MNDQPQNLLTLGCWLLAVTITLGLGCVALSEERSDATRDAKPADERVDKAREDDAEESDRPSFRERMEERRRMRAAAAAERDSADQDDEPDASAPLSARQIERTLRTVHEANPRWANHLREVREEDPDRFRMLLQQTHRSLQEITPLKETDPPMYRVKLGAWRWQREAILLHRNLRQARERNDPRAQEEIVQYTAQAQNIARKMFEAQLRVHKLQLDRAEKRLEEIRAQLAEQQREKPRIIERMTQRMISGPDADARERSDRSHRDREDESGRERRLRLGERRTLEKNTDRKR